MRGSVVVLTMAAVFATASLGCLARKPADVNLTVAISPRSAPITTDRADRNGLVELGIKWPRRDRPSFSTAAIPDSTLTIVALVFDQSGAPWVEPFRVGRRSEGASSQKVRFVLRAADNLSIEIRAYREANPDLETGTLLARAVASGVNVRPGQMTSRELQLDALLVPLIRNLLPNMAPSGDAVEIEGDNIAPIGDKLPKVSFNGIEARSVISLDSSTLRVVVPEGAKTGSVRIVHDGIPSESSAAIFWVPTAIDMDAERSPWDSSTGPYFVTLLGQVLQLSATPTFAMADGDSESNFGPWPSGLVGYTVGNSSAGSMAGSVFQAAGSPATTAVTASIGSLSSETPLTVSVEDVERVDLELDPPDGVLGPYGASAVRIDAFNVLTGGATAGGVILESSDPATVSIQARDAGSLAGFAVVPVAGRHGYVTVTGRSTLLSERSAASVLVATARAGVATLAGDGTAGSEDGSGSAARFYRPLGITVGNAGMILVADTENHRIRKIGPTGAVATLAGSGETGSTDGNGLSARFNSPSGLAVGKSGKIFVADTANHVIRVVDPAGSVSTFAGDGTEGLDDATGVAARFRYPRGVAVDGAGTVYVADTGNHCIRKISPEGAVATLAGTGESGFVDGPKEVARFRYPWGIAIDGNGEVLVADALNHAVRRVGQDGAVSTLAGDGTESFADGTGGEARFASPHGLAIGSRGSIFVADTGNHRVRLISPDGNVSTLAGDGTDGFADGSLGSARFSSPQGLAVGGNGTLYLADWSNRIRILPELSQSGLRGAPVLLEIE